MNKKFEGRNTALLLVDSLAINVGEVQLTSSQPFPLHIGLDYYGPTVGDDEQPADLEYISVHDIRLLAPLFMTNSCGVTVSLDARQNLLDVFTDEQHYKICTALLKPSDGLMNTCKVVL